MDDDGDLETQENELIALESIYEDRQFTREKSEEGKWNGKFQIFFELKERVLIRIPRGRRAAETDDADATSGAALAYEDAFEELELLYLPPIILRFSLPTDYPSRSPPSFNIACKWLDLYQLSSLCQSLDNIWIEQGSGCVILFQWFQFLSDEALSTLGIEDTFTLNIDHFHHPRGLDSLHSPIDKRIMKPNLSLTSIILLLTSYNETEKKNTFNKSVFECNVCFGQKQGSKCIQFPTCEHVFCNDCMGEFFRIQIQDGAVLALHCPSESCESQASPSQVKELVSSELYEKYERFLLQSGLDCMPDIIYCPRTTCQLPVIIESESTCAICANCDFAFCIYCKRSFHGVAPCQVTQTELKDLRDKYLKASPEEKEFLEKRYGKERLKQAMEEMISEQWLDQNAKKCPVCGANIQKSDGCNKMTCTKCRCYFCWICNGILSKSNPYFHFNNPGGQCYNKLFEGIDIDAPMDLDFDFDDDDWGEWQ